MKDFLQLAESRYSVRDFSFKEVEQDKLDKILQAGRLAPTAKNNQPQVIYVIRSKEALEKIKTTSPCIYNSTTVLMCCADKDKCWNQKEGKYDSCDIDLSIVTSHMMLEAEDLGIGSCWVLMFDRDRAKELFNLPSNIEPLFLLPIGYKSLKAEPAERHFDRKPINETTIEL